MKPTGLPFLLALALAFAGPPLVCGLPLVVLLRAGGEPSSVETARVGTAERDARSGRSWRPRGLVQCCTTGVTLLPDGRPACVSQDK
jgi:hypothetical protein